MKKLTLVAAGVIAAGAAGAVLGMGPSGADPSSDANNMSNVTGEPYGKAVAILHAMGYKAVFGGAVGGDVPQSQCVVTSQKMIASGSRNGAISSNGPTSGSKMQLMLDCTKEAQALLNQGPGPAPAAPAQSGAGAGGAPGIGTGDGGNRPTPGAPGTVTVIPTQVG